jgi:hypothetical protein
MSSFVPLKAKIRRQLCLSTYSYIRAQPYRFGGKVGISFSKAFAVGMYNFSSFSVGVIVFE